MILLAGVVVVASGLFLIGLTTIVFVKPALAERFFLSFASSARTHYVEQALRLLIGVSLVVCSPTMWQTNIFRLLGWIIVVTSFGLMLIPWRWHHRFGEWVLPTVVRHMRLYGLGLLVFGALLLYGVFSGDSRAALLAPIGRGHA